MKNIFLLVLISFLISNISYSEEKTLRCLFVLGERNEFTDNGTKTFEFGKGDKEDEYLVIDFEKKRIKSAPYYQGFFRTNFTFQPEKITWSKTKKIITLFMLNSIEYLEDYKLYIIHYRQE